MARNTENHLLVGIEAIERIDTEIADLQAQIKELKEGRKERIDRTRAATGIMAKAIIGLVNERKMEPEVRRLYEAHLQIGRAQLGMLDGTPLGDHARKAFEKPPPQPSETRIEDPDQEAFEEIPDTVIETRPAEPTEGDLTAARDEGGKAAAAGHKVIENPYPADQPRLRGAWDEGWCTQNGSDGMDIPPELQRKRKKPANDEGDGKEAA